MFLERRSERTLDELRSCARPVLQRHGLHLYGIQELHEEFLQAGIPVSGELLVFRVADVSLGRTIVPRIPQAAAILPYHFSAYSRAGATRIAALLPSAYRGVLPIPRELRKPGAAVTRSFERRLKAAIREMCRRRRESGS
jgi:hypothetical protein